MEYHRIADRLHAGMINTMDGIDSAFLSQSQYDYLVRSLQSLQLKCMGDSNVAVRIVNLFVSHYYNDYMQQKGGDVKARSYRKLLDQSVAYVAAHLSRMADEKGNGRCSFVLQNDDVTMDKLELMCNEHVKYKERNLKTFQDITCHHRNIKKGAIDNDKTTSNKKDALYSQDALNIYAVAAHYMGAKDWVIKGNSWMRSQAMQYFMYGGAEKRRLKDQRKENADKTSTSNIELEQRLQVPSSGDKKRKAPEPADGSKSIIISGGVEADPRIRLLDVGSCYNPFDSPADRDVFDVVALDLQPVDQSKVYKCDFLHLQVGDPASSSLVATPLDSCCKGSTESQYVLQQLPGGSFDVVCMSLVLSYVPSPQARLHMVRKARELLKSPCGDGYYGGLLLVVEKESILAGAQAPDLKRKWRAAVESVGFVQMRYELINTKDRRSHCYAFRAVHCSGGDIDGLYIRSDD